METINYGDSGLNCLRKQCLSLDKELRRQIMIMLPATSDNHSVAEISVDKFENSVTISSDMTKQGEIHALPVNLKLFISIH